MPKRGSLTLNSAQIRIAAIHDISGVGRCSLSVISPILSAMGHQLCPVPTAVLSAHTGGLGEVALHDLTDFLPEALAHYQRLELQFQCVYTGFLSSAAQIDHCLDFFSASPGALKVVDPVMGDHGKPYRTYTPELCRKMESLARAADVITPNPTEAAILLGREYEAHSLSSQEAKSTLVRLAEKGPRTVVITGVSVQGDGICNIGYDRERSAFWRVRCNYMPVSYPGTGDMYAAVLVGGLLSGDSLPIAMERATRFLEAAIKLTYGYGSDTRYGVMFERALPLLWRDGALGSYDIL